MQLKPPGRVREALELLALMDDDSNLEQLLHRVDWTTVTPRQIYLAILDRLPESASMAVPGSDYSPYGHARDALLSPEFQEAVLTRVLGAYPEKQRLLFVHVPKCAGTDLIENLSANHPWLYNDMSRPDWTPPETLMHVLRRFVIRAGASGSIFVSGHLPLQWYVDRSLCRFYDRLFTVIRQPHDIILSQVNYVFKRFYEAPRCHHPDTREWADLLGIGMFDRNMPPEGLRDLGFRILSHPQIVAANYLCNYLGEGTVESAIDMMARTDIEVTDTTHYQEWLKTSWGIDSTSQANKSTPIIRIEDLNRAQRDYIADLCREDQKLYDRVFERMERRGDGRVFGSGLV
jgi:hypothetical protein